ncbi:hypothetical protein FRX31_025079 [Thalictrum thalictroides]|uniref:Uncharacterized protein n=1 Tax=Thalictrum thalictroides TaxID=46969 RepID=A0A7J6VJR6_THATH|nr:hypothetical protein FRX31_025079 [Thalictrum thalictroides]
MAEICDCLMKIWPANTKNQFSVFADGGLAMGFGRASSLAGHLLKPNMLTTSLTAYSSGGHGF